VYCDTDVGQPRREIRMSESLEWDLSIPPGFVQEGSAVQKMAEEHRDLERCYRQQMRDIKARFREEQKVLEDRAQSYLHQEKARHDDVQRQQQQQLQELENLHMQQRLQLEMQQAQQAQQLQQEEFRRVESMRGRSAGPTQQPSVSPHHIQQPHSCMAGGAAVLQHDDFFHQPRGLQSSQQQLEQGYRGMGFNHSRNVGREPDYDAEFEVPPPPPAPLRSKGGGSGRGGPPPSQYEILSHSSLPYGDGQGMSMKGGRNCRDSSAPQLGARKGSDTDGYRDGKGSKGSKGNKGGKGSQGRKGKF